MEIGFNRHYEYVCIFIYLFSLLLLFQGKNQLNLAEVLSQMLFNLVFRKTLNNTFS